MQAEWLIHNVNIATMQAGNKPYGTTIDGRCNRLQSR